MVDKPLCTKTIYANFDATKTGFWIFIAKQNEMTQNIVKNGTSEPEIEDIKNISRGHQFKGDAIAQLECIIKCKKQDVNFFILQMM